MYNQLCCLLLSVLFSAQKNRPLTTNWNNLSKYQNLFCINKGKSASPTIQNEI